MPSPEPHAARELHCSACESSRCTGGDGCIVGGDPPAAAPAHSRLDALAVAAIEAASQLQDDLNDGSVAHPQEFGMTGCPACKARDQVTEAIVALQDARDTIRLWRPE